MDRTLFALPLLAGKTEAARAFLRELEGERKAAYAASEARLGLTKEVWAVQALPAGDCFVVYFEGMTWDLGTSASVINLSSRARCTVAVSTGSSSPFGVRLRSS